MLKKGTIDVKSENIFPIIKKFLYTEQEIFIREMVSNAVDATTKLKILASQGEIDVDVSNLYIEVILDEKKKTITVRDFGIGMTAEEVDRYINQIAFSSAEEFIKNFKSLSASDSGLIGHFGLGFYSAFMVADKVEIITKSYKASADEKGVRWVCHGTPEYEITEYEKSERGTDVILHISEDAREYLDEYRMLDLLKKYCRFLPVPIRFGEITKSVKKEGVVDKDGKEIYETIKEPRIINNTEPLWKKPPQNLEEKDYIAFYRELYPGALEDPLFYIHINVDYPFRLTGILYFPKLRKAFEVQREKIQLYCNQVFVTDSVEQIVPDFLTLLHGVIDSPDIPLNVSRSALQTDPNVRKISRHITKKVADKLEEIFKNDRQAFEKKWEDIKVFIEYGMMSDPAFAERAKTFALLKNINNQYYTFDEYRKLVEPNQSDKNKKVVFIYTTNEEEQQAYIEKVKNKGYDILVLDSLVDPHFVNYLEQQYQDIILKRVDADTVEKLVEKDIQTEAYTLSEEDRKKLQEIFEEFVKDEAGFSVEVDTTGLQSDVPVVVTRPEFIRRMKDMSRTGGMEYMDAIPDSYHIVVHPANEHIKQLLSIENEQKRQEVARQLFDLALLEHGLLKGSRLREFIQRTLNIMK